MSRCISAPRPSLALGLCTALLAPVAAAQVKVDPRLARYEASSGVAGSIKSVGSDTMNNLMALWAEGFRRHYPNVEIEIEGKGSSTAPAALSKGAATFGPMSRRMAKSELDAFEEKFGYKPVELAAAIDMLAVYVHKDNPIAERGLSLAQLDAIFSKTRKGGHDGEIRTWGDLGLGGEWADKPISMFGRNSASGTYGYFKKTALFGGDFRDEVKEQPGSSSVVQGVASDRYAIGYSGIGYRTADVAVVPLAEGDDMDPVAPTAENVSDYPMSRFLLLTLNHRPGSRLDPLRREFLQFVYSREGQEVVVKDGYLPLSLEICTQQLEQVGLEPRVAAGEPGH